MDKEVLEPRGTMELNEGRNVLTLIWPGAEPKTIVSMPTERVDETIKQLAFWRSAMLPEIPQAWTPGTIETFHRDPKMILETDQLAGDALLHVRHPHFGWLHFILSKSEARKIGDALLAQANAEPPAAKGRA